MGVFDWWCVALFLALVLVCIVPWTVEGPLLDRNRPGMGRHPDVSISIRVRFVIVVSVILVWVCITLFAQAMDEQDARDRHTQCK